MIKECQANTSISIHQICGRAADEILREAARLKTMDNISIVVMGFKKLSDYLERIRYSNTSDNQQPSNTQVPNEYAWNSEKKSQS